MAARSFEELEVWQAAHQLVLDVYRMTEMFPKHEMFGLTSQFRRAAVSIPANIAEGFKKRGKPDKLRFYNIAQGSLEECRYYVILAHDLGYNSDDSNKAAIERISRMLDGYMKAIMANCP